MTCTPNKYQRRVEVVWWVVWSLCVVETIVLMWVWVVLLLHPPLISGTSFHELLPHTYVEGDHR
jgi:hypothetical protein